MDGNAPRVRLDPWSDGDLWLLRALNAPDLMTHLGGSETEEQVLARHARYLAMNDVDPGEGRMFRITLVPPARNGSVRAGGQGTEPARQGAPAWRGVAVGSVGFWENVWDGQGIYESGWGVLAAYQRRGIATAAAAEVARRARSRGRHRQLHAFPAIGNAPSNAVCRGAGYRLLGECLFSGPQGRIMRCNDWCLDLRPATPA
jgi:RimJ/RimL family protein N-acetyltransferase